MGRHKENIYIGTSGWNYRSWQPKFYREGLEQEKWLDHYSGKFNSVEINNTFYQLPEKSTFKKWSKDTPESFIFAVKASRYITHMKKLNDCAQAVEKLMEYSSKLGDKLGIFLLQLPSNQGKDYTKLENFLKLLPDKYQYAFEFRHDSWFDDSIFELLEKNKCGIVINSSPGFPFHDIAAGAICYIRMHGDKKLYSSRYSEDELKRFAEIMIKYHDKGYSSYIYFNNDAEGHAVEDASRMQEIVEDL